MSRRSVSFDRAADFYDETRALPPEAMERLIDVLADRLRGYRPTLEIGVGTGRYAVPLRAAGVAMHGVDISPAMLARLRLKDRTLPVARADATGLPFPSGTFGSALAVHVLHLVPAWRSALDEIVRVVRPGGLVLVDDGGGDNPVEKRFFELAGRAGRKHPGLNDPADLDEAMAVRGAGALPVTPIDYVHVVKISSYIDSLGRGEYSRCWDLPPETLQHAAAETRAWAAAVLGDLDAPLRVERTIKVRAYRLK